MHQHGYTDTMEIISSWIVNKLVQFPTQVNLLIYGLSNSFTITQGSIWEDKNIKELYIEPLIM